MKVIKFAAEWCGPCKAYAPVFLDWVNRVEKRIDVEIVDVEKKPERAQEFRIMSVPTTVLLDDEGNEIKRSTDRMTLQELNNFIENENN